MPAHLCQSASIIFDESYYCKPELPTPSSHPEAFRCKSCHTILPMYESPHQWTLHHPDADHCILPNPVQDTHPQTHRKKRWLSEAPEVFQCDWWCIRSPPPVTSLRTDWYLHPDCPCTPPGSPGSPSPKRYDTVSP